MRRNSRSAAAGNTARRCVPASVCIAWLICAPGTAAGADIYAKKMEIVRTPEGQVTFFRDSVSIGDGETRITAGWARVNESKNLAVIAESVVIRNPDAVITTDSCVYHMDSRRTELFGNVRVEQESVVVLAPALEYVIDRRLVQAHAGLVVLGRGRDFRLTGRRGSYDLGQDIGVVDEEPRMTNVRNDDSVVVTARQMQWDAREARARAAGEVVVESGRTRLDCDSLLYLTSVDSGRAWGAPTVTDSVSRTAGDTVTMLVRDGNLSVVTISGNARSTYRTEGGEQIEVSGRLIVVTMDKGEVGTIAVHELGYGRLVRRPGG